MQPGSSEYTVSDLVDNEIDATVLDPKYRTTKPMQDQLQQRKASSESHESIARKPAAPGALKVRENDNPGRGSAGLSPIRLAAVRDAHNCNHKAIILNGVHNAI